MHCKNQDTSLSAVQKRKKKVIKKQLAEDCFSLFSFLLWQCTVKDRTGAWQKEPPGNVSPLQAFEKQRVFLACIKYGSAVSSYWLRCFSDGGPRRGMTRRQRSYLFLSHMTSCQPHNTDSVPALLRNIVIIFTVVILGDNWVLCVFFIKVQGYLRAICNVEFQLTNSSVQNNSYR